VLTHGPRSRELLALLLSLRCAVAQPASPAPTPVSELLRTLSRTGIEILYSSELVPPTLVAATPSSTSDPMLTVLEALAANDLQLKKIDDRHYVVTRAQTGEGTSLEAAKSTKPRAASPLPVLEELIVFASHYAFKNATADEPRVLDTRGIEQVAGTQNDALRAVRAAPGVASTYSSRPYLRGANPDEVLVRFDGITLTNPFHFREFQSLISPFVPAVVERIDMYSGGFPVRFGARLGGVIDVAPRVVATGYEVGATISQLGVDLTSAGHADRWPVEWLVAMRRSTDGTNVLNPVDANAGEPTFADALARLRWQATPNGSATLGWLSLNDRAQATAHDTNQLAEARSHDEYLWFNWSWVPGSTLQSQTSMAYTQSENSHFGQLHIADIADGTVSEEHNFKLFALHSEWAYMPNPALVWNLGAELSSERAALRYVQQESFATLLVPGFVQQTDVSMHANLAPGALTWGFFASVHRPWRSIETEVGMRVDAQDYQGFGRRAQLTPRLAMRYSPAASWHVYASWGQFGQAQRVDEYRSEEHQSSPDSANRAHHSVVGLSHDSSHELHWRAELYRHRWTSISPYYSNTLGLVTLLPDLQPDRVRIAPTTARSDGIELSARRSFDKRLELWGTYTLSHAVDESAGRAVPRSWDQRQAANLGMEWAGSRTRASMLMGWHSGWPRTLVSAVNGFPTGASSLVLGERNALRWGDYFSVDLHLAQSVPLAFGELSLWMDVANATNRGNDCCTVISAIAPAAMLPEWSTDVWSGRHVNIGFTWHLQKGH